MRALLATLLVLTACSQSTLVGSLICANSHDCTPPSTVCGADGRCVPGCLVNPDACVAGAACDATSGECSGGPAAGISCASDSDCDPPDLICRTSDGTCVAGCTVSGTCVTGFRCNPTNGHCCDDALQSCPNRPDAGQGCNTDSECVGAPANICSGGACVAGCASSGCTAPLVCDSSSGHCQTAGCTDDSDCDDGSYCTQSASCDVLAYGGKIDCAGGTVVYYRCAVAKTPADMVSCAGAAGPVGCPYCLHNSCYHPGLCSSDNDCHAGDRCSSGLCFVASSPCPTIVAITDVIAGKFAAGKEVCVRAPVTSTDTGYDGMIEIKLGTTPYLFVDVSPMYQAAGVVVPSPGPTVTVHGVVRWDDSHDDFELLPVDWIGP